MTTETITPSISETSQHFAIYSVEFGSNQFTESGEQSPYGPNHYNIQKILPDGTFLEIYFCDYEKQGIETPNSYSRLEITLRSPDESYPDSLLRSNLLYHFIEFGLTGDLVFSSIITEMFKEKNLLPSYSENGDLPKDKVYEIEKIRLIKLLGIKHSVQPV
ncbi:MAG: hypothetical protein QGF74_00760 [Candidatus Nanoarchaeia archaeon]|jgi:hypothetical protein|nr:hypothetical protein [Candidatus Nanoarchaeia archaeon]|tara:strand:- start:6666 stop:7148 length:483 start_codon:yes stop_codon:yes gene_type:complete